MVTAADMPAAEAAGHEGAPPPPDPELEGARLARRLVTLAATAIQARVADCTGAGVLVWSGGRPDVWLSGGTDHALGVLEILADPQALPGVPPRRSPAALVESCRHGGAAAAVLIRGRPARLLSEAGATEVRTVCAAPVPAVAAVVLAFLSRDPRPGDLDALTATGDLVTDTVRAAAGVRDHLVVPPTRLVIEQAKGVLMAHHGLGPDEAFDLLRAVSQKRNVPVRDIAHTVVNNRPGVVRTSATVSLPHVPTG